MPRAVLVAGRSSPEQHGREGRKLQEDSLVPPAFFCCRNEKDPAKQAAPSHLPAHDLRVITIHGKLPLPPLLITASTSFS
jgi:hypothetical protein